MCRLQVSFTFGDNYASDMFCGISRMYIQLMHARILHHHGMLKIWLIRDRSPIVTCYFDFKLLFYFIFSGMA